MLYNYDSNYASEEDGGNVYLINQVNDGMVSDASDNIIKTLVKKYSSYYTTDTIVPPIPDENRDIEILDIKNPRLDTLMKLTE